MREPVWWYGAGSEGWLPRVLAPVGGLYGIAAQRRLASPPAHRADVPVIAIGNFTAGGTGKTPFVRVVVATLRQLGHVPVVLTRGYGGTATGPRWVDPAHDTADAVGDEPLLLAADVAVMVAHDRAAGARAIAADREPSRRASVIVMDDGLQNPALAKDLRIAVVDAARGFGNCRCIPAGPLRAPLVAQMTHVDAIVLNRGDGTAPLAPTAAALLARCNKPVLSARIAPVGDLGWLAAASWIAYAGIGTPERFFATLEAAGATVRDRIAFGDHHAFTQSDAENLLSRARAAGALLITTEKDHTRLAGHSGALGRLRHASHVLPVRLALDAADDAALTSLLAAIASSEKMQKVLQHSDIVDQSTPG